MKPEKVKIDMSQERSEGAALILQKIGVDRLTKETERAYREFVESVNRAKESDMEQAMMGR